MHFEDLVVNRSHIHGLAYQRRGRNLALLWQSYADLQRLLALAPTSLNKIKDLLIELGAAAYLMATKGDETTIYVPVGDPNEFFSTLDEEIDILFPLDQITYTISEVQMGLFVPSIAPMAAWYRLQHLYLLCEYQHQQMSPS